MSNELTTIPAAAAEVDLFRLGEVLAQSGYFQDARQAAQAIVKVMAGRELGFGPIASMTGIHIIQGRPAIGADLMAKAVKRSGRYNYRVTELTDEACSIDFFEKSGEAWQPIGTSRFTRQDATKAKTKNLDAFPRNMLFARAMSNGVKWFCPDALGLTTYTPEELEGIEAAPIVAPAPAAQPEPAISQTTIADRVLTADPMTPDQLRPWLLEAAARFANDAPLPDGWRKAITGHLNKLTGSDTGRHVILSWAFGVESSNDLTNGQWHTLYTWLDIRKADDGKYYPSDLAAAEIKLAIAAVAAEPVPC